MTYTRYWAMALATAICGGFIAIERFAFAANTGVWIAFGVAVGATVFSLGSFVPALVRENHAFSGLSWLTAYVAGWTIIAVLVFNKPTATWLAFAGGVAILVLALRALALHETTVERVVYTLERAPHRAEVPVQPAAVAAAPPAGSLAGRLAVSSTMRSWTYWLAHAGLALAGAFVVLLTFALTAPGSHHPSPRWIAFGIGIAATSIAMGTLFERSLPLGASAMDRGSPTGRRLETAVTTMSALIGIGLIVSMALSTGATARWLAFAFGCGLVGVSLVAHAVHEITSERLRHELQIAEPETATRVEQMLRGMAA